MARDGRNSNRRYPLLDEYVHRASRRVPPLGSTDEPAHRRVVHQCHPDQRGHVLHRLTRTSQGALLGDGLLHHLNNSSRLLRTSLASTRRGCTLSCTPLILPRWRQLRVLTINTHMAFLRPRMM